MKPKLQALFVVLALIAGAFYVVHAGDMAASYSGASTSAKPQTTDTDLVIAHKVAVNQSPGTFVNITTAGTTSKTSVATLDRIVINTVAAGSTLIVKDGTNAIATLTTAAQASLAYGAAITTGSLVLVSDSTANITVVYK